MRVRTFARVAVAALAATTLSGCVDPTTGTASGGAGVGDPGAARAQLSTLTVAAPRAMTGYSREHFPHWTQQGGDCDTREVVLKRDGTHVVTGSACKVTGGQWLSWYDNKQISDPTTLDIDHMVPLANAWRSGADAWTDDKRSQFANDLTRPQLLAVSATTNRAKGDQDPSQWKPPYRGYWCQYAQRWIAVKQYWRLTVTEAEKAALVDMLGTCQWPSSAPPT